MFAIGINGAWGSGKTSFINLLKSKLKKEDLVEINFNPWNSNSPNAIIQDFFDTLQEGIRPFHSSLSRLLASYSKKLVKLNDNKTTQAILTSINTLFGDDSLNKLYDEINISLNKIDNKIIVYIDDLDRLDKDEIVEVIRLIRNTANFHNTYFIVSYDRAYVVNALKMHSSYSEYQYLEKIFQIEVTLPY
ncbi:MAG: AAA family ATPase [Bacteroidetes bacterium]|nr:AAA family ATPase [Bacteroidota bacterium]